MKILMLILLTIQVGLVSASEGITLDSARVFIKLNGEDLKERDLTFIRNENTPTNIELISTMNTAELQCTLWSYYSEYEQNYSCGTYCRERNTQGDCLDEVDRSCSVSKSHCEERTLKVVKIKSILKLNFSKAKKLTNGETHKYNLEMSQLKNPHVAVTDNELVTIKTPRGSNFMKIPSHYLYDSKLNYKIKTIVGDEINEVNYGAFEFIHYR